MLEKTDEESEPTKSERRQVRSDAPRALDALLELALVVFASLSVYALVREIVEKACIGVATVYRHLPQRSDLIAAVLSGNRRLRPFHAALGSQAQPSDELTH